jgi:hypothetical protein
MLQWIFFVHGGLGRASHVSRFVRSRSRRHLPLAMQGQLNHFNKYAKEKIPYA